MSQYPQSQVPYLGGPPGFAHSNPSGQLLNPPHHAYPPNPPLGVPLGPVVPLQTLNDALGPLYAIAYETSESLKTATKGIADLNARLSAVESGISSLLTDKGHEGDDEGDPATVNDQSKRPRKRARASEHASKHTEKPAKLKPDGTVAHIMKEIVRDEILYEGCDVKKMDELKPSLPAEEDLALKKRIQEGSGEAWIPNFMLPPEHESNKFWIDRIVDESLKNTTALKKVNEGHIPKHFWTREYIIDPVLKELWLTGRKSVKKATDPEAKARADQQSKAGTRAGRRERLCDSRRRVAVGTDKHPPFVYTTKDGKSRAIPAELIIEDATSDVLSCEDEHSVDGIRPDLSVQSYREARKPFDVEGVPPFWRHAMVCAHHEIGV